MLRSTGLGLTLLLVLHLSGEARAQIDWRGFVEYAVATRVEELRDDDLILNEGRVQLAGDYYGDRSEAHFAVDLLGDRRLGTEEMEIREAYARVDLFGGKAELKAGRQPATWGTGDLLFINDLFPKDYVSFFAGRGDQYLKLPVDALRLGVYPASLTLDVLWIPSFTPNRVPTGTRFQSTRRPSFLPAEFVETSDSGFEDGELAARVSHPWGAWKLEGYAYRGFWKNPVGRHNYNLPIVLTNAVYYYPKLSVFGGSLRGTLREGVAWLEGGYYDSREYASRGRNIVPGSQLQGLAGYERTWWSDGTVGTQAQWTRYEDMDVDDRWLLTLRIRQLLASQTVTASLFAFYSPTDEDSHLRASVAYDLEDGVTLTLGGHLFNGPTSTDFGRMAQNDLVYGRLRVMF